MPALVVEAAQLATKYRFYLNSFRTLSFSVFIILSFGEPVLVKALAPIFMLNLYNIWQIAHHYKNH